MKREEVKTGSVGGGGDREEGGYEKRRKKTRNRTTGDEKAEHRKRIDRTISRRHKAEMKRENERYNGYSEIRILSDRGIRDLREIQLPRKSRIMANNENYRLITYHRTSKKKIWAWTTR